jgi:ribosomal protein RSM22 (predicted rRNA methylase)
MTISTALPAELAAAISSLLHERSRKALAERAGRVSEGFRARRTTRHTILNSEDALAYALSRLPATYAATATVLGRIRAEAPLFQPLSLLDAGCGLGAASFAAVDIWPELRDIVMLDRSPAFLRLATDFARGSSRSALAGARLIEADMTTHKDDREPNPCDLVVMSYSATELGDGDMERTVAAMWRRCTGALVVVEPGTPRDFARLLKMRSALVGMGAHIALPCPHARPCPLAAPDWCHFAARLPRSRDHKIVKNATVPFEDEKFSYLVAARNAGLFTMAPARILQPPRTMKYGISLKLCVPSGFRETTFLKSDKAQYAGIRKCSWGDRIDAPAEDQA